MTEQDQTLRELVPGLPGSIVPHGMLWGIKNSFSRYVAQMPDGRAWAGKGAVPVADGQVFFVVETSQVSHTTELRSSGTLAFQGDVRYAGHSGMLFVRVACPRLEVDGLDATLYIEDSDGDSGDSQIPLVHIEFLAPSAIGAVDVWRSKSVRLTKEGLPIFNDVYPEGEEFEPIIVIVPAASSGDVATVTADS